MVNLKIATKGMKCSTCEMIIKDTLEELKGITKVEASHETNAVYVEFNDKVISKEKIIAAIKTEGYTPEE